MNGKQITRELERTLLRLRMGLIGAEQARQEQALLLSLLRAHQQVEMEEKIERLEAALEGRGQ